MDTNNTNTMSEARQLKIRDKRNKGWFYLDNEYLNGYAKIFGAVGTAIYVSLCRHADTDQRCFPSQELIGKELNINPRTVRRYLKRFIAHRLIEVERERKNGVWVSNTYWLIDKSEWVSEGTESSVSEDTSDIHQRAQCPTKNTQRKKKTKIAPAEPAHGFSLKEKIKEMEENKRRDINVIALYFEERKPDIQSEEQYQVALTRHLRAAGQLKHFSDEQILKGVEKAKRQTPEWTIETVVKMLTK
jgi:hypothetical protein